MGEESVMDKPFVLLMSAAGDFRAINLLQVAYFTMADKTLTLRMANGDTVNVAERDAKLDLIKLFSHFSILPSGISAGAIMTDVIERITLEK